MPAVETLEASWSTLPALGSTNNIHITVCKKDSSRGKAFCSGRGLQKERICDSSPDTPPHSTNAIVLDHHFPILRMKPHCEHLKVIGAVGKLGGLYGHWAMKFIYKHRRALVLVHLSLGFSFSGSRSTYSEQNIGTRDDTRWLRLGIPIGMRNEMIHEAIAKGL